MLFLRGNAPPNGSAACLPPGSVFGPDPDAPATFMTAATTVRMSAAAVVSLNTQMEVPALRQTKARSKRHTEFETYQAECEAKAAAGMAATHTSGGTGADASTPVPPASPPPMPTPPAAGWADPAQRTATSAARRAVARWPPPLQRSASAEEHLPPQPILTVTLTLTLTLIL